MASLSNVLMTLYATGELTGTQVQRLAAAAWEDGWGRGHALATRLCTLGAGGTHASNITRDLMRTARQHDMLSSGAQPYEVDLPFGAGKLGIFLPHEVIFHLRQDALGMSASQVADTPLGRLLSEWSRHPDIDYDGPLSNVCVLGLHADGVQYTSTVRAGGARSIIVGSFNAISAQSLADRQRRHTLFVLRKARLCQCGCQGYHTLQAIFKVVGWSLRCALVGAAPLARHDGTPFTESEREVRLPHGVALPPVALLQVRGDWEWLVTAFRFRSFNSQAFCWLCDATQSGPLAFRDFRDEAPHRGTLMDHRRYMVACSVDRVQPSTLFDCPGLCLHHIAVDSMHAGDLGVFQDAVGSLFWLEVGNRQWHRTRQLGCVWLNEQLNMFYSANPGLTRLTPLSLSQLTSSGKGGGVAYPTLRAKAAMTRHSAEFARILAYMHRDGTARRRAFVFRVGHRLAGREAEYGGLLVRTFDALAQYHRSCGAASFQPEQCKAHMMVFLQSMAALHDMWRAGVPVAEQAGLPWKLRPKAHMLQHLVSDQLHLWGAPSNFWCYGDEDFVGSVKRLAASSRHPSTLEARVAEKLMLSAGLGCL